MTTERESAEVVREALIRDAASGAGHMHRWTTEDGAFTSPALDALDSLTSRLSRLEEALEPFAAITWQTGWDGGRNYSRAILPPDFYEHVQRARTALDSETKPRGGIVHGPGDLAQRSVDEEDAPFTDSETKGET